MLTNLLKWTLRGYMQRIAFNAVINYLKARLGALDSMMTFLL